MLHMESKNINYNASCMLNDNQIAYFNANRNGNRLDVNISIEDVNLYTLNLNIFETDFQTFMNNISSNED